MIRFQFKNNQFDSNRPNQDSPDHVAARRDAGDAAAGERQGAIPEEDIAADEQQGRAGGRRGNGRRRWGEIILQDHARCIRCAPCS